jgi:murein DD-endopeptidase MepM/ murein hydrolase activator NlpD
MKGSFRDHGTRPWVFVCAVSLCCWFFFGQGICCATTASGIKEDIAREKSRASAKKKALTALSSKERSLFKDLAGIEDRIQRLEVDLATNRKELKALTRRQQAMKTTYEVSRKKREILRGEAETLVRALWPVFITKQTSRRFDQGESWARAEREATWLSSLYAETGRKLLALEDAERQTLADLKQFEDAKKASEAKDRELRAVQEELLGKRLHFLAEVKKVRSRELDLKEQLEAIAGTIKDLHYKLELLDTRSFSKLKGHIAWPAKGRVVERFKPKAQPPHRGLSLALSENHPVRAVSWGKVVYDDQLRGFGRVVIVFHGEDYYSLYAFLSQSRVTIGQKVEKGEVIGSCGYYPLIKGSGLYFELRFQQKAINPLQWLEPA